ncbi:unnamed protein product [Oncorhynchus mykiss]|uniref:Uncharacterized protein n=1 Tax=Oncorhynchus mykiss TaxID=8022 RepID=A0A060YU52_ONCMY|nr:unnamed protein product [Oncorhynchus mykiss]
MELDGRDILLQTPDQGQIPVIRWRRKLRFCGKRSGCLVRIRRRVANLPLPSVLLANVKLLQNKWDELKAHIFYHQDIKNCKILCFTESWLDDDIKRTYCWRVIHSIGRTEQQPLVKTRGGGLCIYVNNSWCTTSKEVSRFCSPEVEYLMISCRPHCLPSELSSVVFVAVYIPPETDAGTKTTLNELFKAIGKQENAHPEAAPPSGWEL